MQPTKDWWETIVQEINNAQVISFASTIAQIYFPAALANWGVLVSRCFHFMLGLFVILLSLSFYKF